MHEHVYLLTIGLPLLTILLVFGMRYYAAVQQAKARLANDDAYRAIAEKAASTQADTANALEAMNVTLADLKSRLAAVEKILKEVE
jgi:predicted negative regulator of RcsB-dependent stress response